ncbi:MAG: helix-turn-helix domain-containing protein [Planctomycetota bacterium]
MDPDLPRRAVAAFESLTGLAFSLHDRSGVLAMRLPADRTQHRNPWCRAVKAVASDECVRFCSRFIHASTSDGQVVSTRCHAGLIQWAVTGISAGRPVWVLFAGVRRAVAGQKIDLCDPATPARSPSWLIGPDPPPPATNPEQPAEALAQLNARLLRWYEDSGSNTVVPRRRDHAIREFIRANQGKPLELADLAHHLGLSSDRTRHAVSETCGQGFSRLLNEERLVTAAQLLRHTDLSVADVAKRCGFNSVAHFHARFRTRWGKTPTAIRRTVLP